MGVNDSGGAARPTGHDTPTWPSAAPVSPWASPRDSSGTWEIPGYWSTEGYYHQGQSGYRSDDQTGSWSTSAPPIRRARGLRSAAAVLVIVAAAIAGASVSRAVWTGDNQNASTPGTVPSENGLGGNGLGGNGSGSPATTLPAGSGAPADVSAIASRVDPAVVDINSSFDYNDAAGAGTGIVLSSDGLVLTNNHVIAQSTHLAATDVGNGRTYNVTVLGYDNTSDVALVQLQGASGLTSARLASGGPSVGEAVVAIGNAGGAGGTPTSAGGSVTALDQSITASDSLTESSENLNGLIQVNANVQSGDSGGPLVDAQGEVIGMDTAASQGYSFDTSGAEGFAIPISDAMSIAHRIESGRGNNSVHVGPTAFLGVLIGASQRGSDSGGDAFGGFGTTVPGPTGVAVEQVVNGGPAQKAGILGGDYITALDGHTLGADTDLTHLLVPFHPGQKVRLRWVDQTGQAHTATVTLASGPPS